MRWLRKTPVVLFLVIIWATLRFSGVETTSGSVLGIGLILASMGVLILEFQKSGDISMSAFMLDITYSVATVASTTFALTKLYEGGAAVNLVDVLVAIVATTDAWLSPTNSFRTALRNLAANLS